MNAILEQVLTDRKGHYVHTLEVSDVYELKSAIDSLYDELIRDYDKEVVIDFITSMSLYCLVDENDSEVYDFNITEYINNL